MTRVLVVATVMQDRVSNLLLRRLAPPSFNKLAADLELVALPAKFHLAEPGRVPEWVYFPDSGVASIVGHAGKSLQEVGLFGQDGIGCPWNLTGPTQSPYLVLMQVSGHGHRLSARVLHQAFEEDAAVRAILLSYVHATMVQLSQNCIANGQFNTVERMARWFLMIQDRVNSDTITLTHDFIATTLGVGRTGVTLALHTLEDARLISIARKRVTILDRLGLERMTAGVYGFAEADYRRRFAPAAPSRQQGRARPSKAGCS